MVSGRSYGVYRAILCRRGLSSMVMGGIFKYEISKRDGK